MGIEAAMSYGVMKLQRAMEIEVAVSYGESEQQKLWRLRQLVRSSGYGSSKSHTGMEWLGQEMRARGGHRDCNGYSPAWPRWAGPASHGRPGHSDWLGQGSGGFIPRVVV